MKLLRFLTGRLFLTALSIAIQIAWIILLLTYLAGQSYYLNLVLTILSVLMVLYVIKKDDNPAYKIGWILIMLLLPILGGALYLLVGNKRPTRRMRRQLERVCRLSEPALQQDAGVLERIGQSDARMRGLSEYVFGTGRFPSWENTESVYFPIGEEMYAAMLNELETAKEFIFLEFFIINEGRMWSTIRDLLTRKAAEGVDVRLIYDDMGSIDINRKKFLQDMRSRGIKAMAFNPFVPLPLLAMNNRDHRKIMVIDGKSAFTGGVNLADEYINEIVRFGHWKDAGIMIRGEAVYSFTVMFLEMWNAYKNTEEDVRRFLPPASAKTCRPDGFVQPFCDSPLDNETVSENVYLDILAQAKNYVYIFTPYLLIDSTLQSALCLAAKRGVDVRIVTPGIPDKHIVYRLTRSYYTPLLKEGVRIYEYTPGFLHSKCLVSDDEKAVVGSINLDFRSLYLHFECGALLYRTGSVNDVKRDILTTLDLCHEVSLSDRKQTFIGTLVDAVLRVFSPLL